MEEKDCTEKKDYTEVFELGEDILVVGRNLQSSGLPITFDSLGTLWERYGENDRRKHPFACQPYTEYAVCLNRVPDYITGCAVTEEGEIGEGFMAYTIPAGRYIKDVFCADSFEQLVGEALTSRKVKEWAKKNKVKINRSFSVEVYPWEEFDSGNFAMYTLTPIE